MKVKKRRLDTESEGKLGKKIGGLGIRQRRGKWRKECRNRIGERGVCR